MSKDRSRASLLIEQLDFEAIDGSEPKKPDPALDFDFDGDAAEVVATPPVKPNAPAGPARSTPPAPNRKTAALEKKSGKKSATSDRFGVYAALIVMLGFAILLAIFFYMRSVTANAAGLSYFELPQQVANLNGQVVRMQVTIQVRTEDKEWLFENKKVLSNVFQIEFAKIDPDDLHSEEGFDTVRAQLKSGLNQALKSDKIESVLINELLMQNRE
ncbi:flagellar basal body-associated protein FliL [Undibacterium sp.]|uniref:flagellar basal body-associated FliL family protein n=1 Tax=Undibacterium sp. TaxID=1914977 RepID=UPI00272F7AF9|nr:flagellar basal body-associated FliL family protein [Undibacterium sp.]MDP1979630.1 flagellar basal body-associated FliL family protein [Undibacterium sp.]